jgi:very-short-patch-repair endonuclease
LSGCRQFSFTERSHGNYIVDFDAPEAKIDVGRWLPAQRDRDLQRGTFPASRGLRALRFDDIQE